jgi:hypothetical protein
MTSSFEELSTRDASNRHSDVHDAIDKYHSDTSVGFVFDDLELVSNEVGIDDFMAENEASLVYFKSDRSSR